MMNKEMEKLYDLAIRKIQESKNIFISSHVQPDGDNIGSMLALGLALKKINKNVFILKTDDIPSDYLFLPNIDIIKDYNKDFDEIDTFIALDSGDDNRLGKNKVLIDKANNVINIDHHVSNTEFGNINIVDGNAAATGELVYKLITKMNIPIDKDIARCIYTAISTDTGSFMYDSTSYETHEIVAKLLKFDIEPAEININLYQNRSIHRTKLFIRVLETLSFHFDNKVATVKTRQSMLNDTNTNIEDTEGILSFVREIANVEIAIMFKEFQGNETKVSMRSKRYMDVASICSVFKGGGHIRAAGCSIDQSINYAEELILKEIQKRI